MRRARESPSPVPLPLVVKNGRKICCNCCSGIPFPVSLTVTRRAIPLRTNHNPNRSRAINGLNRIEQKIQNHLVNLIAVVLDLR